ncbi:MAG: superoxide dismutase family protein [Sphingomonadaceae bacterium]|nr:superoxide dismutase family protein [Sphingomonadaceae bacterium]
MRKTMTAAFALAATFGATGMTVSKMAVAAQADLRDAKSARMGTAAITLQGGSMRLVVSANGLPPGPHGLHIHATGKCDGPDFKTAGPHWNPGMKMHGRDNPMGAHKGDLPNLMVGADGRGSLSADLPGGLADLLDADGASIVVHAAADDYKTDPSGNSGARIACGVFERR